MAKPATTATRSNKTKGESKPPPPIDLFNRSTAGEEIVPAKFSFAHRATFIPRRARNPRTELFLGYEYAELRRPDSGVEVAFRITFPHRSRDNQKDFEILAYDDAFWWPLCMLCWEWEGHLSEQDCLKELESGNWNLLSTFAGTIGDTSRPRPDRRPCRRSHPLERKPREDRRQRRWAARTSSFSPGKHGFAAASPSISIPRIGRTRP